MVFNNFFTLLLALFAVIGRHRVVCCSPPNHRASRSFRARAHYAEVVVFATVLESPVEVKQRINAYYSAQLSVHCILKGPPLPRVITVHGFGNDGGGCTRTDASPHKSYVFLLRKSYGSFRLHNVGVAPAAKRAREKILLRLLPDFWRTSHRPYKRWPSRNNRTMHCPTLKKMKRILRRSMRKYIQSKPDLSKRRRQLKEWLKKLRSDRKLMKGVSSNTTTPLITTNTVESLRKSTLKHYTIESRGVNEEKSRLAKRSIVEIAGIDVDYYESNAASTRWPIKYWWWLYFAWFVLCILVS